MRWGHAHPTWTYWALPFLGRWLRRNFRDETLPATGKAIALRVVEIPEDEDLLNVGLWEEKAHKQWCKFDITDPLEFQFLFDWKTKYGNRCSMGGPGCSNISPDRRFYKRGAAKLFYTAHHAVNPTDTHKQVDRIMKKWKEGTWPSSTIVYERKLWVAKRDGVLNVTWGAMACFRWATRVARLCWLALARQCICGATLGDRSCAPRGHQRSANLPREAAGALQRKDAVQEEASQERRQLRQMSRLSAWGRAKDSPSFCRMCNRCPLPPSALMARWSPGAGRFRLKASCRLSAAELMLNPTRALPWPRTFHPLPFAVCTRASTHDGLPRDSLEGMAGGLFRRTSFEGRPTTGDPRAAGPNAPTLLQKEEAAEEQLGSRRGTGKGNVSRSCPFFFFQSPHHCQQCEERIYPIHVAAQLGGLKIVKMLLEDGADPLQECFDGRNAVDFARNADVNGSHQEVMELLEMGLTSISF
eukprot:g5353.t2